MKVYLNKKQSVKGCVQDMASLCTTWENIVVLRHIQNQTAMTYTSKPKAIGSKFKMEQPFMINSYPQPCAFETDHTLNVVKVPVCDRMPVDQEIFALEHFIFF